MKLKQLFQLPCPDLLFYFILFKIYHIKLIKLHTQIVIELNLLEICGVAHVLSFSIVKHFIPLQIRQRLCEVLGPLK